MSTTPTVVAGRYRLLRQLGAGGMGQVWLAHDDMLDRHVAIKQVVLPPGLSADESAEARERTMREARTAAQLNHPSVVKIYDVVEADEQPWIVMEYVPARSLHDVVNEDGPLEPVQVARIGLAVLDALDAAHQVGVLHRDVKPGNVLLTADDRVVLTDFGLATFDTGESALTQPGLVFGSVRFVAPEGARDAGHLRAARAAGRTGPPPAAVAHRAGRGRSGGTRRRGRDRGDHHRPGQPPSGARDPAPLAGPRRGRRSVPRRAGLPNREPHRAHPGQPQADLAGAHPRLGVVPGSDRLPHRRAGQLAGVQRRQRHVLPGRRRRALARSGRVDGGRPRLGAPHTAATA